MAGERTLASLSNYRKRYAKAERGIPGASWGGGCMVYCGVRWSGDRVSATLGTRRALWLPLGYC